MIFIIGSGSSAVSAACALVERGIRPTILDVGIRPEPVAAHLKSRLGAAASETWSPAELGSIKRTGPVAANGIPRKLHFGSDFVFREPACSTPLSATSAAVFRSFALGGFSNVWGAVVQPIPGEELDGWPIQAKELTRHYEAVRRLAGVSSAPVLRPSSQAAALYGDLSRAADKLHRDGIWFDYAKLAVRAADQNGDMGCRYCGLCLFGCPYDSRYTAAATLGKLVASGLVTYQPDVLVRKLTAGDGVVRIEGQSPAGASRVFAADRVLVAAGFAESTRMILESLGLYGKSVRVKHSDIFTLPLLRYRSSPGIRDEKLHTLCQVTAEIQSESLCSRRIHLQFYGYNELYRQILAAKAGPLAKPLRPALQSIAERLFVIFGYLHSDVSSGLELSLTSQVNPVIAIQGKANPDSLSLCMAVARKLQKHHLRFGGMALSHQLKLDLPGGGYHSGGTLPMRRNPGDLETDALGHLKALPRVHVVDASVLPNVPASPTAFTVMANAHRIASEVALP